MQSSTYLVDDQKIRLRDSGTSLPWNLITSLHVHSLSMDSPAMRVKSTHRHVNYIDNVIR